jgi:hypothetical protein
MALGVKTPTPSDFAERADSLILGYRRFLAETLASLPLRTKVRRRLSSVYRSKGERQQIASYYHSDFTVETGLDLLPTAAASTREARFDRPSDATSGSKLHDPKKAGNGKKSLWRHPSIAYWF